LILRFLPEAARELAEARAWYEEQHEGLGEEFQRAFDATATALLEFPESHPYAYATRRRALIRRFPYFLLYEVVPDAIVVLGCIHFARNPAIWGRRSQ
jgi:hypothetical protein